MTMPVKLTFLQAIAREEGYYKVGTRPQRNNNPGDVEYHPWMAAHGSKNGDPRFAVFPSEEQGFSALKALFGFSIYKGKTVSEAIRTFAPEGENDTAAYIANVCAWAECQPTDIIDGLVEAS